MTHVSMQETISKLLEALFWIMPRHPYQGPNVSNVEKAWIVKSSSNQEQSSNINLHSSSHDVARPTNLSQTVQADKGNSTVIET